MLSAIEFFKAKYGLKVKAVYIKSDKNTSADALSRGRIPPWLLRRGIKKEIDLNFIMRLIDNPVPFWKKTLNPFRH